MSHNLLLVKRVRPGSPRIYFWSKGSAPGHPKPLWVKKTPKSRGTLVLASILASSWAHPGPILVFEISILIKKILIPIPKISKKNFNFFFGMTHKGVRIIRASAWDWLKRESEFTQEGVSVALILTTRYRFYSTHTDMHARKQTHTTKILRPS